MRKIYQPYLIIILFIFYDCSKEQEIETPLENPPEQLKGTVIKNDFISSDVLGKDMNYSIYLPPGYDESEEEYPVLYLLHGMWGNYLDWVSNGMESITNNLISKGNIKDLIVVMPDGIDAFYCNNYGGGEMMYEDYMIQEFIPQIEEKYRIKSVKGGRAIAGLSMGGYGATFHAFKRPEMFGSCYSMSGALEMGDSAPDLKEIIDEKILEQVEELPAYTMECGIEDFLVFSSNESFDNFLVEKDISHDYIKRTGSHDWSFWMACLPKALKFASQNFE